jgi:hypothetical protein
MYWLYIYENKLNQVIIILIYKNYELKYTKYWEIFNNILKT